MRRQMTGKLKDDDGLRVGRSTTRVEGKVVVCGRLGCIPLTSLVDVDKIRSDRIRYDNVSKLGSYIDQGNHAITTKKVYPT
jgi:hypothetical protein